MVAARRRHGDDIGLPFMHNVANRGGIPPDESGRQQAPLAKRRRRGRDGRARARATPPVRPARQAQLDVDRGARGALRRPAHPPQDGPDVDLAVQANRQRAAAASPSALAAPNAAQPRIGCCASGDLRVWRLRMSVYLLCALQPCLVRPPLSSTADRHTWSPRSAP